MYLLFEEPSAYSENNSGACANIRLIPPEKNKAKLRRCIESKFFIA